ncbi:MAG: transposase [Candidatus Cloacimonetes bacterium]|jgi:REP element-mobilizing transposase RayT|nr:transposase [Candidatus Cloacimonadota bacterium]
MNQEPIRYWSHGPHYQFPDSIIFLTWRLAFTLPKHVLKLFSELSATPHSNENEWTKAQLERNNAYMFQKFLDYDAELASLEQPGFSLSEPEISKIMRAAFHFYSGKRYELHAFCVMPNHVHLLLRAVKKSRDEYHRIADIVKSLKSYTALKINKHLGQEGQIWDHFYFDRVVRDQRSYENVVQYILLNPVKAKFVEKKEDWSNSYFDPKYYEKL